MTFTTWLLAQAHRDDRVGDSARSVRHAIANSQLEVSGVDGVRRLLNHVGATAAELDVVEVAAQEWSVLVFRAEEACRRHGIPVRYAPNLVAGGLAPRTHQGGQL